MTGSDMPLLVTGGAQGELAQLVRDLLQLGYTNVQSASDPDVALGLLLTAVPPVQTLVCMLDSPAFDSLDFLAQALEADPTRTALLLIHAGPEGELGKALELATLLQADLLGALQSPVDLVRLVDLLQRKASARPGPRGTPLSRHELASSLRDNPN